MRRVFALLESAAQSQAPVVITCESGTGKELAAQAIHDLGPRAKGPFIRVNCAALNEALLESELFGHVKGAFTGAERGRVGRFEAASGGDIFLDEIGDLPLATQVKLLRVLQEGEIERVGDHRPIKLDVRVITATNQDLARLMAAGRFREDLYYRIAAIPVPIPPLRERREDIPLLAEAFLERIRLKTGKPLTGLAKEALELLLAHDWPGNVRELINALEYAFVLCPEGLIRPEHLPARIAGGRAGHLPAAPAHLDRAEAERIKAALDQSGGNLTEAARLLGLSRVTLWKKLKRLGLETSFLDQQPWPRPDPGPGASPGRPLLFPGDRPGAPCRGRRPAGPAPPGPGTGPARGRSGGRSGVEAGWSNRA
jgi:transcriptional regulator with PAS, ATPase and Fis domain